jgi:preprotein translocase subunit SecY
MVGALAMHLKVGDAPKKSLPALTVLVLSAVIIAARWPSLGAGFLLVLFAAAILVTAFVVFVERGQRKITVNYAKRQVGNKIYGGQSSFLPLKLNMSGVIPPIFASSLILFPATLASWSMIPH